MSNSTTIIVSGNLTEQQTNSLNQSRTSIDSTSSTLSTTTSAKYNGYFNTMILPQIPGVNSADQQIACGQDHVLMSYGQRLFVLGRNSFGQLGVTGDQSNWKEVKLISDSSIKKIATGFNHSMVVLKNGIVLSTGRNDDGQLGLYSNKESFSEFTKLEYPADVPIHNVFLGGTFSILVGSSPTNKNAVFVTGQLGSQKLNYAKLVPFFDKLPNGDYIESVACGYSHALFKTAQGNVYAMGSNNKGQLGLGHYDTVDQPTLVKAQQVKKVTCGMAHSVIVTESGDVMTCGSNEFGQLGQNISKDDKETFSKVSYFDSLKNDRIVNVGCGPNHTVFVSWNGSVYSCGDNSDTQLGYECTDKKSKTPQEVELPTLPLNRSFSHTCYDIACTKRATLLLHNVKASIFESLQQIDYSKIFRKLSKKLLKGDEHLHNLIFDQNNVKINLLKQLFPGSYDNKDQALGITLSVSLAIISSQLFKNLKWTSIQNLTNPVALNDDLAVVTGITRLVENKFLESIPKDSVSTKQLGTITSKIFTDFNILTLDLSKFIENRERLAASLLDWFALDFPNYKRLYDITKRCNILENNTDVTAVGNRYVPIKELGKGATGIVVKSLDVKEQRVVALKIYTYQQDNFAREIECLEKIGSHPNIIDYYGSGTFTLLNGDSYQYIAMEFAMESLSDRINREKYSVDQALEWFYEILLGVQALHSKNLLHRDLKPENVLIVKNMTTGKESLKLADFGTVRNFNFDKSITINTVGSIGYISPECWGTKHDSVDERGHRLNRNRGEIDMSSDYFSLGCILFKLLTKNNTFGGLYFCEAVKSQLGQIRLHNWICEELKKRNIRDEIQRLNISLVQRNPAGRPKLTTTINIISTLIDKNTMFRVVKASHLEVLLELPEYVTSLEDVITTLEQKVTQKDTEIERLQERIAILEGRGDPNKMKQVMDYQFYVMSSMFISFVLAVALLLSTSFY